MDGTIVTPVDLVVETYLVNQIREHYPTHAILTEETGVIGNTSDWVWVIDPIDGTRAYATGLPIWGISVGLLYRNVPYLGGFYLPMTGEMVWGDGRGGYYNGRRLTNSHSLTPQSPTAFIAVPSDFHQHFSMDFPRLRSFGSTAAHLSFVARDVALAAIAHHTSLWDLAGLLPIFKMTDIEIQYLSGKPLRIAEVLSGEPLPEAVIAAPLPLIDGIRRMIHNK